MKKQIAVAVILAILMAASAYAQTTDFIKLVETGTPQEVQTAINQGANVNTRDFSGETPLMHTAEHNKNPEVITVLLKAGADIEAQDTGEDATALLFAAVYNPNPEVITTLLNAGANIEARNKSQGRTALM